MTHRYFDDQMNAWVTVCQPAVARGAERADAIKPRRWRASRSTVVKHVGSKRK